MTRLIYPKNGLYRKCKNPLEDCNRNLQNVIFNCVFDVPEDFQDRNYIISLGSRLHNLNKESRSILNKLLDTTNRFENLEEQLTIRTKRMTGVKIKERERMIR